ncbi:MAG: anaerobic sulfite reductase subunit AsrB [Treponema sp.]|jgi:anaerobic sulfite reductase subunit B|nr:anaerobic sulfite reductase subunit AsrB [Treponema sp.]
MINEYIPFRSEIRDIIRHTALEYTFRMGYDGPVLPGQFFEVSIPHYGEAPISVSGIAGGLIDLTIRRVGKVTAEVFERDKNGALYLRGPYGNGFKMEDYKGRELFVAAGGTGVSPVRGVVEYFASHREEVTGLTLLAGFKSPGDILFRSDFKRWEKSAAVILTTDTNGGDAAYRQGLVTEYIPGLEVRDLSSAQAIVVGPPAMMRFSIKAFLERGFAEKNLWISQERRMCCGLGKCGHCRINDVYVCLDGPVFNYTQGKLLAD